MTFLERWNLLLLLGFGIATLFGAGFFPFLIIMVLGAAGAGTSKLLSAGKRNQLQ